MSRSTRSSVSLGGFGLSALFIVIGAAATGARAETSKAVSQAASTDFSITVSIVKEGEDAKGGSIEFKNGKCTTTNGPNARSQASKVCKEIGERIVKDESTYTVLPWINSPHIPSFVVVYKSEKSSWTRETGVSPDRESKTREALRALAVKVLETAK